MLRGTVTRRIIRLLDTTSKSEEEAEGVICRLLGELRRARYEKQVLRSAMERVRLEAWGGLRSAVSFLQCSVLASEKWCAEYEALLVGCEKVNQFLVRGNGRRLR